MAGAKMFAHRLILGAAILGFGCAASGIAYKAAGAAMVIGSYASLR